MGGAATNDSAHNAKRPMGGRGAMGYFTHTGGNYVRYY
jgi:hypothetical protein